ncbi:hypothetical protein TgHK011_000626 [Trichoderma gracile]|nr:hypothetical protein TgHK011_000626 [Trichoderma gracile]
MPTPKKTLPSTRWTSLSDWPSNTMNHRLSTFVATINRKPLIEHASEVLSAPASMSTPFSTGQYWAYVYGNSLQDVKQGIYNCPISTQEHIYAQ